MTPTRLRTVTLAVLLVGAISNVAFYLHYTLEYVDPAEFAVTIPRLVGWGALPYALIAVGTALARTFRARLAGLVGASTTLAIATAFNVQIVLLSPHEAESGVGLWIVLALQIAIALLTVVISLGLNFFLDDD